jgi:hypothetical protein
MPKFEARKDHRERFRKRLEEEYERLRTKL